MNPENLYPSMTGSPQLRGSEPGSQEFRLLFSKAYVLMRSSAYVALPERDPPPKLTFSTVAAEFEGPHRMRIEGEFR
jgi:hypothetical protein